MRKFLKALVLIPLAVIFLAFAIANRQFVTVSFDPFNSVDPTAAMTLPLFVVIIGVAILGVAAGSVASWFRHRGWRRAAKRFETEARDAKAELAALRARPVAPQNGGGGMLSLPFQEPGWRGPSAMPAQTGNVAALRDNRAALL